MRIVAPKPVNSKDCRIVASFAKKVMVAFHGVPGAPALRLAGGTLTKQATSAEKLTNLQPRVGKTAEAIYPIYYLFDVFQCTP